MHVALTLAGDFQNTHVYRTEDSRHTHDTLEPSARYKTHDQIRAVSVRARAIPVRPTLVPCGKLQLAADVTGTTKRKGGAHAPRESQEACKALASCGRSGEDKIFFAGAVGTAEIAPHARSPGPCGGL